MKRFPLVVAALVLSLLGSCTPASKLPQFARDDYFYSELEIPGFPFNFVYLNFVRNFDDGTADGDITLHRADANVTDGGNLYSREVGGQLELTFDVTRAFDPDNPLGADLVAATLLVSVRSESLDSVLLVPELEIESEINLTGPTSEETLAEILDARE